MDRRHFLRSSAALPVLAQFGRLSLLASDVPPETAMKAVVTGNTAFATDLYSQLGKVEGNQFFSPYSVSAALSMTSAGAANATLEQMVKTLHLPSDQAETHAGFAALTRKLLDEANKGGYELKIANALWGQAGLDFKESFLTLVKSQYGAGFQTVNFREPEPARQMINRWVEQQTKDKIKDLFASGTITPDTRLVLANAIYFKGTWASQFQPSATKDLPFFAAGAEARVPTMHQKARFLYAEGDDWQALQMRYKNCTLAMEVFLPKARDGLAKLEKELTPDCLAETTKEFKSEEVNVFLPRFKTTISYDLTRTLAEMGMPDAFSRSQADFSRMTSSERLMIGIVVHKAFVDVTEQGTEAAAATGVGMKLAAAQVQQEPKMFRADHPFAFVIRDTATGSVLFAGRVAKP